MSRLAPQPAVVTVSRYVIPGFRDTTPCTTCGEPRVYHHDYDAYFCPRCNSWLESTCLHGGYDDPCRGRPERPLAGCLSREGRAGRPFAAFVFIVSFLAYALVAVALGATLTASFPRAAAPTWVVPGFIAVASLLVFSAAIVTSLRRASRYLLGPPS